MAVQTSEYRIMLEENNFSSTMQMLSDNLESLIEIAERKFNPEQLQNEVTEIVKKQVAAFNQYYLNIDFPLLAFGSGASHIYISNAFDLRERYILIQFQNQYK